MSGPQLLEPVRLLYYAARGSADMVRMLLREAGLPYVDDILTAKRLKELTREGEIPFGAIPMLTMKTDKSSVRVGHAPSIMRFLARSTGFYGENLEESTEIDQWADEAFELINEYWSADFHDAEGLSDLALAEAKSKFLAKRLRPRLEAIALAYSMRRPPPGAPADSPFVVGAALSYADVTLFSVLDAISKELPMAVPLYPGLQAFCAAMRERPRINAFLDSPDRY
eukprot:tig00021133_g18912.t1